MLFVNSFKPITNTFFHFCIADKRFFSTTTKCRINSLRIIPVSSFQMFIAPLFPEEVHAYPNSSVGSISLVSLIQYASTLYFSTPGIFFN
nr:MAG TPA: hypothetical protein [Caudoviricetes sp.]